MTAIRTARDRARAELTREIKDEARRQLAIDGPHRLSLRSVARELGMVSSALYRYFPSRDELLTALIIDAYDAVGAAAEKALARAESEADSHLARWQAVCHAVRGWALKHPHEYALIYGSPVPGYSAPQSTTGPAARVGLALFAVARDAHAAGALRPPGDGAHAPAPESVLADARRLLDRLDVDLPEPAAAELIAAWAQLFGLVSFELFGQFANVTEARDAFFEHAVTRLADGVGLVPAAPR